MPVSLPTPDQLRRIAADMNLSLTVEEDVTGCDSPSLPAQTHFTSGRARRPPGRIVATAAIPGIMRVAGRPPFGLHGLLNVPSATGRRLRQATPARTRAASRLIAPPAYTLPGLNRSCTV
jgi:hypothetical protein